MDSLPKCFILPIDDSEESLRPIGFLSRLYPKREEFRAIVSYFLPPLPPVYLEASSSRSMMEGRRNHMRARAEKAGKSLERARKMLLDAGFARENIQEYTQEREGGAAIHTCRLADLNSVDAVVVQKRTGSTIEEFIKGDSPSALVRHCRLSPVWFTDGTAVGIDRAAICIADQEASLRAVDHAAFMLEETDARITLLHASPSASVPISSPAFQWTPELEKWLEAGPGETIRPFIEESRRILESCGIDRDRAEISIIPGGRKIADEILSYCVRREIGIAVLGHSEPEGFWSFLGKSIAGRLLTDFRNMSVWINQ